MLKTKRLLAVFAVFTAAAALGPVVLGEEQAPLPGSAIPQFVHELPLLSVAGGTIDTAFGNGPLTIRMCEFNARLLPPGTFAAGIQPETRVWGYIEGDGPCPDPTALRDTYTGPVIVNTRGVPTTMTFINDLGSTASTGVTAYRNSVDQTIHWADPLHGEANECSMAGGIPAFGSPCAQNYAGPIPATPHLHGGEVPPEIDGGPDSWVTSDGIFRGHAYYTKDPLLDPSNGAVYRYPNTQQASPIWFHDHTLGATRLNVYAGLAGAYLIVDPALQLPPNLPGPAEIVPMVLQDRMFDTAGQLYFPTSSIEDDPNPEHPYWVPEFVGDTIVVNGKAWPYLNVSPKRYRFLFLNGSNARTYELFLEAENGGSFGPALYAIGTDGGYLDSPVKLDPARDEKLVIMPGERYEVIIDFAAFRGSKLLLRNVGRTPYPKGDPPQGSTVGRIVQFRVSETSISDESYDPSTGAPLRVEGQRIVRLVDPSSGAIAPGVSVDKSRQLTLNEVVAAGAVAINPVTGESSEYAGGPLEILVNNTRYSGASARSYGDFTPVTVGSNTTYYSETPQEGHTEVWELVNLTADAHPIHLHLVQFQLLNRQNFNLNRFAKAYGAAFPVGEYEPGFGPPLDYRAGNNPLSGGKDGGNPDVKSYLQGPVRLPAPQESGWKDTVMAPPGMVTRIAVRWAPTDLPATAPPADLYFPFDPNGRSQHGYVWHCHIIDHEDNEMMRPDLVELNPAAPTPDSRPLKRGVQY